MGDQGYTYANIMREYKKALMEASERIGLDSHGKILLAGTLDSKVINEEIKKMHAAGKNFVNDSFVSNIAMHKNSRLDELKEYTKSMERPKPVNEYYNDDSDFENPKVLNINADMLLSDLHNAFNQGIFQNYNSFERNSKEKSFYDIYSDNSKVRIKLKI